MKEKRTRRKSVTITFEGRHRESQQLASELKEVREYIKYKIYFSSTFIYL